MEWVRRQAPRGRVVWLSRSLPEGPYPCGVRGAGLTLGRLSLLLGHRHYRQLPPAHVRNDQALPVGTDGEIGGGLDSRYLDLLGLRVWRRQHVHLVTRIVRDDEPTPRVPHQPIGRAEAGGALL